MILPVKTYEQNSLPFKVMNFVAFNNHMIIESGFLTFVVW
jgi:hypothetical protein